MTEREQTPRQRLIDVLDGRSCSARDLARLLNLPERDIEDHLVHIVRSLRHDRFRTFHVEPATCLDCGFVYRERTKLTCPSRCPNCRSEGIAPPRFGIRTAVRD